MPDLIPPQLCESLEERGKRISAISKAFLREMLERID
jgi:hypothetical protein